MYSRHIGQEVAEFLRKSPIIFIGEPIEWLKGDLGHKPKSSQTLASISTKHQLPTYRYPRRERCRIQPEYHPQIE